MRVDLADALIGEELKFQERETADELSRRYGLAPEVAQRIAALAKSLDQACAVAELMRSLTSETVELRGLNARSAAYRPASDREVAAKLLPPAVQGSVSDQ